MPAALEPVPVTVASVERSTPASPATTMAAGVAAGVEDHGAQGQIGHVADRTVAVGAAYVVPGSAAIEGEKDMAGAVLGMDAGDAAVNDRDALGVGGIDGDVVDGPDGDARAAGCGVERSHVPGGAAIERTMDSAIEGAGPDELARG